MGLAVSLPGVQKLAGQDAAPTPVNPFSGFQTHFLSNGVKVWFKRLEGAPDVAVSVGVPVGRDADPPGKAHLAHFLEHMLFTDHKGLTEQEILQSIWNLGGRGRGLSHADRTWYSAVIGREHGFFAIEWLADIMSPHEMEPSVVDRNRGPLIVELGARPPDLLDRLVALLTPETLLPSRFWEREFGLEVTLRDPWDLWLSLQRITSDDLHEFYDRYYAPGLFTVTIVGDLDRTQALATAERTFGSIPPREVNRWPATLRDPRRTRTEYRWHLGPAHRYVAMQKLFNPSADEFLTSIFIRDFLYHRINQRIRRGERKAVYTVDVALLTRGPAAMLNVRANIHPDEYTLAREAIEDEIESLRTGTLEAAEFERVRTLLVERLRARNQTSESLVGWTNTLLVDPDVFTDFPDVIGFFEALTQEQVASFAETLFDPSRRILEVTRASPVGLPALAALSLALFGIILGLARWEPGRAIRRADIRYIARLRIPLALSAGYTVALAAASMIALVAGRTAFVWAADRWLYTTDSLALHTAVQATVAIVVLVGLCRILASIPYEVLVAKDHLRLRSRTWRSRILDADDIAEISTRDFHGVWLSPRAMRTVPLAFGLQRQGIFLRPKRGRSYFFRTRNTDEFAEVLQEWWEEGRPPTPTAPPEG